MSDTNGQMFDQVCEYFADEQRYYNASQAVKQLSSTKSCRIIEQRQEVS